MTKARTDWLATLTDPEVSGDLERAARACMSELDDCAPELCDHSANRMTPLEFVQWIELKGRMEDQRPARLEPAGRPGRRQRPRLHLATAG